MAKARLPISKHMPAARIGRRHVSPFTCSPLITDAGNTVHGRGCSTHIIVCGWQKFTEAAWLYTDALQKAPELAELHEGRAAALLVRSSCDCTSESKDIDDCGATVTAFGPGCLRTSVAMGCVGYRSAIGRETPGLR